MADLYQILKPLFYDLSTLNPNTSSLNSKFLSVKQHTIVSGKNKVSKLAKKCGELLRYIYHVYRRCKCECYCQPQICSTQAMFQSNKCTPLFIAQTILSSFFKTCNAFLNPYTTKVL